MQKNGANPDKVTNIVGNVFVPPFTETFTHDADGNMTQDGRWTMTWDAENRLKKVESLPGAPLASKRKVEYEYDFQGRMMRRTAYNGSSGSYVVTEDLKYVYDGFRCMAEVNVSNNLSERVYVWGLDMSGTMDGAGGVGGLLAVYMFNTTTYHFPFYDGNGNIVGLVNANDGTISANYEYDTSGKMIRQTGTVAKQNSMRFSTKYTDDETDLLYYRYRYYNPSTGRWPSRDPIEERGGMNLYGFVANNPAEWVDYLGLNLVSTHRGLVYQWQFSRPSSKNILPLNPHINLISAQLQTNIDQLPRNDFRRLFLNTQKCILDQLAQGKCCMNSKDLKWLNRVVVDFMKPLFDALDGNANPRWKRSFNTVANYQEWGMSPSKMADWDGPDRIWMWQMESAREMAVRHIQQDLRNALQKNGVGNDAEWKCIGDIVRDCEKRFFNGIERLLGKGMGLLSGTYDVGKLRDNMRDELKQYNANPYIGF